MNEVNTKGAMHPNDFPGTVPDESMPMIGDRADKRHVMEAHKLLKARGLGVSFKDVQDAIDCYVDGMKRAGLTP